MKTIPAIGIVMLVLLSFSSCKKYPDGPLLSLRSRTERVSNTWKLDKMYLNGNDATSSAPANFTQTFDKNGGYSYSFTAGNKTQSGTGKWAFQNNENEIKINGISSATTETLYILKLKEDNFWYYFMNGNDKYEYHMVSQ